MEVQHQKSKGRRQRYAEEDVCMYSMLKIRRRKARIKKQLRKPQLFFLSSEQELLSGHMNDHLVFQYLRMLFLDPATVQICMICCIAINDYIFICIFIVSDDRMQSADRRIISNDIITYRLEFADNKDLL